MELDGIKFEIIKNDYSIVFRAKSPMLMFDQEQKTQYSHDLILSELTLFMGTPMKMMEAAVECWSKAYLQNYNATSLAAQIREHFKSLSPHEIVALPIVSSPKTSN